MPAPLASSAGRWLVLLALEATCSPSKPSSPSRVAVLSRHTPHSWSSPACRSGYAALAACNLIIYDHAASIAASSSAELLLLPEAYGLTGGVGGFEVYISKPQANPCEDCRLQNVSAPAQHFLSCAAQRHNVTMVANLFVTLANDTRRIVEVVFEAGTGAVIGAYFKHHLFPNEKLQGVTRGPFAPTSFVASRGGKRWGLLICYEGLYADLFRDWSQLDSLKAGGADGILWSIGGVLPARSVGRAIALHLSLPVLASEDGASAVALSGEADPLHLNASLVLPALADYTGRAAVDVFDVP